MPDGHLSEDEVSEKDEMFNRDKDFNNKNTKSVMEILEIRKNYSKPVIVNFNLNIIDSKVKFIGDLLKARIFTQINTNINNVTYNLENNIQQDDVTSNVFPIKIASKNKSEENHKKIGMNVILKDRLEEVVREIHMSYMTKEYLIKLINDKIPGISKKALDNFFKESCFRSKKLGARVKFIFNYIRLFILPRRS